MPETLERILTHIPTLQVKGSTEVEVQGLAIDSRLVKPGDAFVALRGTQTDGHRFIGQAIEAGASVVVCEVLPENLKREITWVQVADSAHSLGWMAAAFYGHPSGQLKVVGITGTNGKTSTATLLYQLVAALGYKTGLISTVENRIGNRVLPATHTTPDAISLQALLAQMVESGCDFAFMEVSSHALDQQRLSGVDFEGAVFTNLSHDHLDYHGSFDAYIAAKKKLFDGLMPAAFALINVDDKRGRVMVQNTRARIFRYGLRQMADYKAKVIASDIQGMQLLIDGRELYTTLSGEYNAYNLLATYATARLLGFRAEETLTALSGLTGAAGRLQKVQVEGCPVLGVVDYAHTPDALDKVLSSLRRTLKKGRQLITVVGAGGDRDKAKRPEMAAVAARLSDKLILTSDNPRTENPDDILNDMKTGLSASDLNKTLIISDRRQAIRTACQLAGPHDLVLVAGKGHEKYQEIAGVKHPFDDVKELQHALRQQQTMLRRR